MSRLRCAQCGKLLRPRTETVDAPTVPGMMLPVAGWRYEGNRQVVSRRYEDVLVSPDGSKVARAGLWARSDPAYRGWRVERRLDRVTTWDGERYDSYGNFCTQPCAVRFAQSAYRAGWRPAPKERVA